MSVNLLSLVTDGLLGAAPSQPGLLPDEAELNAQLGRFASQWQALLVHYLDNFIVPRHRRLPMVAVHGAPGAAPQSWATDARIRQALADPATLGQWPRPTTNQLPKSSFRFVDHKLRSLNGQPVAAQGFELLTQYVADGNLPVSAYASLQAARQSMASLRALDAFLIRWSATIDTASVTGDSIAEVLALYRIEGDLIAPQSLAHVQDRLTHAEEMKGFYLTPIADHDRVHLTMKHGLWSYPVAHVFLDRPLVWPPNAVDKVSKEADCKAVALLHWMLVIAGHDFLASQLGPPLKYPAVHHTVVEFMVGNRAGRGLPHDRKPQQDRLKEVLEDLVLIWPDDAAGRVVVVPKTPEKLVAFALTEAMLFFGLGRASNQGPFVDPPPKLRYLAYNLQHARNSSDVLRDRFAHCLAGAAVAARGQGSGASAPLKALLGVLPLRSELRLNPADHPEVYAQEFAKLTEQPHAFLDTPSNLDLLADFILVADQEVWKVFLENRANLARYRTQLAFYTALLRWTWP